MKTFRIIVLLALVGATAFQAWMACRYDVLAKKVKAEAQVTEAQAEELDRKATEHNSLPRPYAELCIRAMEDAGASNVNCIVWGQRGNEQCGFMIQSNKIIAMPGMEVKMREMDPEDVSPRKKL